MSIATIISATVRFVKGGLVVSRDGDIKGFGPEAVLVVKEPRFLPNGTIQGVVDEAKLDSFELRQGGLPSHQPIQVPV